jgi:hypothetical protein
MNRHRGPAAVSPGRAPEPAPEIHLQRHYATEHQAALGPGWVSIPAYYHAYIGVLRPSLWWAGAVLWSRVPETNDWVEFPLREWATLAAMSYGRLNTALNDGSLSWLVERDTSRPRGQLRPDTKTRAPARYRWRCGLPFTPGHQQDVLEWLSQHLQGYGRRPTVTGILRALEDLSHLPGAELRAVLGNPHRPAPREREPLTVRSLLQVAAGIEIPLSVGIARHTQHLYAALAPQDMIAIPDALREDWLPVIGHGPLWLYFYAYSQSLLSDTPGVFFVEAGLNALARTAGVGRSACREWLLRAAEAGLLRLPAALPADQDFAVAVIAPTAVPLGRARADAMLAGRHAPQPGPSRNGKQAQSERETSLYGVGNKLGRVQKQGQSVLDTVVGMGNNISRNQQQAQSGSATSEMPLNAPDRGTVLAIWPESATEEEEVNERLLESAPVSWMALPELALRSGVTAPPTKQVEESRQQLPQLYVALYLENLAADLPAINAWRHGLFHRDRMAAGVRDPYRSLAAAGPMATGLALQYVLNPDDPRVRHALGHWLAHARDLAEELALKVKDADRRARSARMALRALTCADGQSLQSLVERILAQATNVFVPEPDDGVATQEDEDKTPTETDKLWATALQQLQMELPKSTFDTWLRNTTLLHQDEERFCVGAPTAYARDWLQHRMSGAIKRTLSRITKQDSLIVQFEVEQPAVSAPTVE